MKNFLLIFISALFICGCASTVDTTNMPADERLKYAISLYDDESYDVAIPELEAILLQFPGNEVIDDAQFYLGKCRFMRKEYILAAFEFSRLIRNMPSSELVPESQYHLAESYYQLSPVYSLDQRYTRKSVEEFQAFIDFFPTDERAVDAEAKIKSLNDKLALKEFSSAKIYEKLEYYVAAIQYYDKVIETFHDTEYAPQASYRKIKILLDREHEREAVSEMNNFLIKYPANPDYLEIEKLKKATEKSLSSL